MIRFKSCRKCGGDLQVNKDVEPYCLQCGWSLNTPIPKLERPKLQCRRCEYSTRYRDDLSFHVRKVHRRTMKEVFSV